jgi:hypothetical protein
VRVFRDEAGNFAIGVGRVTIVSADTPFLVNVIADLGEIAHRPEGEAAFRQGDALGRRVVIAKPDPPTDPPNGWIIPDDLAGDGCGSTIVYDPADWPWRGDPSSPSSEAVLLLLLRQANRYAAGQNDSGRDDGEKLERR